MNTPANAEITLQNSLCLTESNNSASSTASPVTVVLPPAFTHTYTQQSPSISPKVKSICDPSSSQKPANLFARVNNCIEDKLCAAEGTASVYQLISNNNSVLDINMSQTSCACVNAAQCGNPIDCVCVLNAKCCLHLHVNENNSISTDNLNIVHNSKFPFLNYVSVCKCTVKPAASQICFDLCPKHAILVKKFWPVALLGPTNCKCVLIEDRRKLDFATRGCNNIFDFSSCQIHTEPVTVKSTNQDAHTIEFDIIMFETAPFGVTVAIYEQHTLSRSPVDSTAAIQSTTGSDENLGHVPNYGSSKSFDESSKGSSNELKTNEGWSTDDANRGKSHVSKFGDGGCENTPSAHEYNALIAQNKYLAQEVSALRQQLADIVDQSNRQLALQQAQFDQMVSLLRSSGINNDFTPVAPLRNQTPMEGVLVENAKETKRHHESSGDEHTPTKKKSSNQRKVETIPHTVINGQFVHAGIKKAASKSTPPVLESPKPNNEPTITEKVIITDISECEDNINQESDANFDAAPLYGRQNKRKLRHNKKSSSSQNDIVTQRTVVKDGSHGNVSGASSSQPMNKSSNSTEGQSQTIIASKASKKPPPITMEDVNSALQLNGALNEFKGKFWLATSPNGLRIYPESNEIHAQICMALSLKNFGFNSHKLKLFKPFKAVLKGMDLLPIEEVTASITEAIGSAPERIAIVHTRSISFYIVEFRASEVDMSTLANNRLIGNYRVKWEPYKKKKTGPTQCTNCTRFGHGQQSCSRITYCLLCAEEHRFSECPLKDAPSGCAELYQCKNCLRNSHEANHPANAIDCPSRAAFIANRERLMNNGKAKKNNNNKNNIKFDNDNNTSRKSISLTNNRIQSTIANNTNNTDSSTRSRSVNRSPNHQRSHSASRSYASVTKQQPQPTGSNDIDSWRDICSFMATAYDRIMNASSKQEQRQIAFALLASS